MATLLIGSSSSHCSNCRRDANPHEEGHFTLLGYGPDNGKPGCGEAWTDAMLVYYMGWTKEQYAEYIDNCWFPEHIRELLRKHHLKED